MKIIMFNLILIFLVGQLSFCEELFLKAPFKKIILWGHKLHSHTHSYIHCAFYRAFMHLGYETLWLDNDDDISSIDFSQSLFITEGQADQKIPLRSDCRYILHNCNLDKYKDLITQNNCVFLQVYTHKCFEKKIKRLDDLTFIDLSEKYIYMPWATDLLPHEIEQIQLKVKNKEIQRDNYACFIGSIGGGKFGNEDQINPFKSACEENKIELITKLCRLSVKQNIEIIQKSLIAPAIQGSWQLKHGYIPCRIFKNISYGNWGITNSQEVYDLFERKIVYNPDTFQLFYDGLKKAREGTTEELLELMEIVKKKHTYLNRIHYLFVFLNIVKPFEYKKNIYSLTAA